MYARISPRMDDEGMGPLRDELLHGVRGRVVEVGAGNGMNFRHYPPTTTAVVAVEPEPHLRGLAGQAAHRVSVPVTVLPGTADDLPLETASADVGVVCLMLCALDNERRGLAELYRVIRPGGELRFLEHVAADTRMLRALQRLADATVWPLITGGCRTARDPVAAVEDVGFRVARVRNVRFPDSAIPVPAAPHVLGLARRPTHEQ
jgi:ubiquinone/menaquinone biosynthesis C-methylase UbiE